MNACRSPSVAARRSRQARVSATGESAPCWISAAAARRLLGFDSVIVSIARRAGESRVRIAQRVGGAGQTLEQRLQLRQAALLGVGARAFQPSGYVGPHQKVSVPRTQIGIVRRPCATGRSKLVTMYLTETSKPNGP